LKRYKKNTFYERVTEGSRSLGGKGVLNSVRKWVRKGHPPKKLRTPADRSVPGRGGKSP